MPIAVFHQKSQSGFTLIEMMISLGVGGILLSAMVSFFSFQASTMRDVDAYRAAQKTARGTLEFIARQLTHIGRTNQTPFAAADPAILDASADSIRYRTNLSADWNDDDILDTWEDVSIWYEPNEEAIWFHDYNDASNRSWLSNIGSRRKSYIPTNGLVFTYFDADGNAVTAGTATARASIRRIRLTLTVRGIDPQLQLGSAGEPEVTVSQDIFLRNVS